MPKQIVDYFRPATISLDEFIKYLVLKPNLEEEKNFFERYFQQQEWPVKKVEKDQVIQEAGEITSKLYFVKKGLLRSYTIDENGKIHIYMFAPEGWVVSDLESHVMSVPSELFIDALEDSEIIEIDEISEERLKIVAERDKEDIIKVLYKRIGTLQRRVLLLMSASAQQRYEHFMGTYPQLINRIPLKMVASYLGITPEALSNIRSKMRKK